ncbi:hypothetical protein [Carnobacterium inhibens]|uniref:Uncharacterized protein n=1 Tax=Carnobacterium inhibens TaxID=147709 RepID=A0ABR7TGS2_9LACT|nr:hypothetical protein [Carnobacterium inhibens]MBC9826435.1 hypothetical protein [Carnobacterium inhibens]
MKKTNKNKERFLSELLLNGSIEKAASNAEISKTTAYRYLDDEEFNKLYKEKRKQLLDEVIGQLTTAATKAVKTLEDVLDDELAPPTAKVSASRAILDNMFKGFSIVEIEERLTAIEKNIENNHVGSQNLGKLKGKLEEKQEE